ncbi:MmcQ/YjbR family DNA-binding protein [Paracrocinitomix mangrovi]|uniref:MmcQ/YjbR family DNA-binding protein n=1 Tax=Paracrocinitomix mangrovi TaxID=2862509 RepID=UPI001C8E145D|nr:MmcQ/YjbR family DNA-binding protein [Paracrocinitomix mangrovi]UKN00662.1 MmcQ/YjbR family DNA-binding protein [Paracrocinitomix mangrovi]
MNIEEFREYCLQKKGITEETPFGPDVLVFKVMGKMFALCGIEDFTYINLKCDPDRAIELREQYNAIKPGYHMNKQLWNSVYVNDDVADQMVYELTDHSYDLIVASLTKKLQKELEGMN